MNADGGDGMMAADGGGGGMMAADGGGGGMMAADGGGFGGSGIEYGEIEHQSFLSLEGQAIGTCCCSFFCIPILFLLIFWNELNLVKMEATIDLIENAYEARNCDATDSLEGRLVFAACHVRSPEIARDLPPVFQPFIPSYHGAYLSWDMEIFQWVQSTSKNCQKTKDGGQTCQTIYHYDQRWSSSPVDSNRFRNPRYSNLGTGFPYNVPNRGHVNAPEYSVIMTGNSGKGYALDQTMTNQIPDSLAHVRAGPGGYGYWQGRGHLTPDMLQAGHGYVTTAKGSPQVGDVKITFTGKTTRAASACGKQEYYNSDLATFAEWPPQSFNIWGQQTYPLEKLEPGMMTKREFINLGHAENKAVVVILRIIFIICMIFAFNGVLAPVSKAADLLRFFDMCTCGLGSCIAGATQTIICCAATICAFIVSLVAIGICWLMVRPTLSIGLLLLACGLYFAAKTYGPQMKSAKARQRVAMDYIKLEA